MKFSRKQFVDAYHYTSPEQLEEFKQISSLDTHIDKKGRLQFYMNTWEHIGVPVGYWLVIDNIAETKEQKYKVYNDKTFHKYFKEDSKK